MRDGKSEFAHEMLGAVKHGFRRVVDEEVDNERWDNIEYAAMVMLESEVDTDQIKKMLIKYWDLRPSEASEVYQYAEKCFLMCKILLERHPHRALFFCIKFAKNHQKLYFSV